MVSVRTVSTFMVLAASFLFMWFIATAVMDPFTATMLEFNAGGMDGQIEGIHVALVKYMVPVAIFSFLGWAVYNILSEERQTRRL